MLDFFIKINKCYIVKEKQNKTMYIQDVAIKYIGKENINRKLEKYRTLF